MRSCIVLALSLVGSLSCQGPGSLLSPDTVPAVRIEFSLKVAPTTGSSSQPVTITTTIRNLGRQSVDMPNTCPEPPLRIYDARGGELFLNDPTVPVACATVASRPLQPGTYVAPLTFDGVHYRRDGTRFDAPPQGTYRAVATFTYIDGGMRRLTREVVFSWR